MAINITIDQFASALRLRFVPSIREAMEKGLEDGGKIVARKTRATIRKEKLIYRGELVDSVEYQAIRGGSMVSVTAPHAKWLEYGTRPFTPPIAPLKWWAVNKLGLDEDDAASLAWNIQQKYRKEGIKPRHFFRRSVAASLPAIRNAVEKRVMRAEQRLFRKVGRAVLG